MFCPNCGAEQRPGTRFCSECGAPVQGAGEGRSAGPEPDADGEPVPAAAADPEAAAGVADPSEGAPAPEAPATGARGRRVPVPAAVAALVATAAVGIAAVYLGYTAVLLPARTEQATDAGSAQEGETSAQGEGDEAPASPEDAGGAAADPGASDPAPAEQHDFECEWFYVDVPDSWVRDDSGATPVEGGPKLWSVTQEGGVYVFTVTSRVGSEPDGYPIYEAGSARVLIGSSQEQGTTYVGTLPDGREVWLNEVSAGFFAADGYFEGDRFVSVASSGPSDRFAVITLRQDAPAAAASQSADADEAAFVATARAALKVPDDPSITYTIGEPTYWEGADAYTTYIEFQQDGETVAFANCWDDGSPARNIYVYTAP